RLSSDLCIKHRNNVHLRVAVTAPHSSFLLVYPTHNSVKLDYNIPSFGPPKGFIFIRDPFQDLVSQFQDVLFFWSDFHSNSLLFLFHPPILLTPPRGRVFCVTFSRSALVNVHLQSAISTTSANSSIFCLNSSNLCLCRSTNITFMVKEKIRHTVRTTFPQRISFTPFTQTTSAAYTLFLSLLQ